MKLGEFVTVGVGLAFGTFGSSPQVGAQLVTVAGGVGAEAGQHLVRIGADPVGLRLGGFGGSLRGDGFLLRQPGGLFGLLGTREYPVPAGLGGADPSAGLAARLRDRGVPLGFCGGGPRGGILAGRLDHSGPVVFRSGADGLCLARADLGGGRLGGHLLCSRVGLCAPLVGFGGCCALLGGGADGFDLGFGGRRVVVPDVWPPRLCRIGRRTSSDQGSLGRCCLSASTWKTCRLPHADVM